MAHCKRKSDGERSWSIESRSERVTRGEDGEDQYEGDEHLNNEGLSEWHSNIRSRGTQIVARIVIIVCREAFENSSCSECPHYLYHDVQQRPALTKQQNSKSSKDCYPLMATLKSQNNGPSYSDRWWVGCYIWYSEEGSGRTATPLSPLLAVPNVTAHPSTVSVPTSYYSMWHYSCLWIPKG